MKNYWYFVGIISSLVLIPNNYRIKLKRQTETYKSHTKYLKPQGPEFPVSRAVTDNEFSGKGICMPKSE